jgi:hypothetical protein
MNLIIVFYALLILLIIKLIRNKKVGGFFIIGYVILWLIFMICMSIKLYFDVYGYPNLNYIFRLINNF